MAGTISGGKVSLRGREDGTMSTFNGEVKLLDETGHGVPVVIDLTDGRLTIGTESAEIGSWSLDEVRIHAEEDGFHLRAEGDEVVVVTEDDAGFAIELGMRSAPPLLRRQMAARLRDMEH
jgi:hypothetical protein